MMSMRAFGLAFATVVVAGCGHSQTTYSPTVDCPKELVCGQCASRGQCVWCGDSADGGKGQCVAAGYAKCDAPNAWTSTPDRCPPPPAEKPPGATASSSSAGAASGSAVRMEAGAEKYEAVRRALSRAFPSSPISDHVVDGVVLLLRGDHPRSGGGATAKIETDRAPLERPVRAKEHQLYLGYANHHRVKSPPPDVRPMQSEFTMVLPLVRVTLPERLEPGRTVIATEIGDVDLSLDHLLGSLDLIAAKYGGAEYLGQRPARVDLVTPARDARWRFGAIAVYLGYRHLGDRQPSFYMLEAGKASGDSKMIYFSPDMKPILHATSYYTPTAFVTMSNTYSGTLSMRPSPNQDEPAQLVIQSYTPNATEPYITVTVDYQRKDAFGLAMPIEITLDAAARVALIAKTMGLDHAEELQPVLSEIGKTMHWTEYPRYVDPAATNQASH